MNQFSGISTGTTLGKGLEDFYKNKEFLADIEKIKEFIIENTGYRIETATAAPKYAIIKLRPKND